MICNCALPSMYGPNVCKKCTNNTEIPWYITDIGTSGYTNQTQLTKKDVEKIVLEKLDPLVTNLQDIGLYLDSLTQSTAEVFAGICNAGFEKTDGTKFTAQDFLVPSPTGLKKDGTTWNMDDFKSSKPASDKKKNAGEIVGTVKIEADLDSFRKAAEYFKENTENLSFEEALSALKAGKKVTNSEWNGKDQYIFMMPGYLQGVPANEAMSKASGVQVGESVIVNPHLMIKNTNGVFSEWVPSTGDLFSNKWKIITKDKKLNTNSKGRTP